MSDTIDVLEPHQLPSLKSRVVRAGGWTLIAHVVSQLIRLVGNLVLTRLLAPEVFGIMAIVTVIQTVVLLPADIGLEQIVIRSKREDRTFLNVAFTIQLLRGFFLWLVFVILAAGLRTGRVWGWLPIASVYARPDLPLLIIAASFSTVILGLQSTKVIIASRKLDLRSLTFVEIISQVAGLFAMVFLAWIMSSVWAVVIGGLLGSFFRAILTHVWWPGPINHLKWEREAFHELLSFGKWTSISSGLSGLATNGDRLLLGSWFSPAMLGYYSIAFGLAAVFEGMTSRLFGSVLLPALSEVHRRQPDRLPDVYFRTRWICDSVFVGAAGFLYSTGEWIIALMYDARYAPAGEILKLLSFGLLFSRYGLAQVAYLALGKPYHLATINSVRLISLLVLVPALFYTAGINGAILGVALHQMPTLLWVYQFNDRYRLNNLYLEVVVLAMWPLGWLMGLGLLAIAKP